MIEARSVYVKNTTTTTTNRDANRDKKLCDFTSDGNDQYFVILCFSLLLRITLFIIKTPLFLDIGKNIVKWLGQCFLPELAN